MRTKKKVFLLIIVIVIAAIAISVVWYFSPKAFLRGVEPSNVKSIYVFDGNTGKEFVIESPEEIERIVKNIQEVKMKRDSISVFHIGYSFIIKFTDKNGNAIDSFIINSTDTVRDDPFFYRCDGNLCYDYLKELEDMYTK